MRIVRAILIDPFACTVTEIEHDAANYRNIYALISHESMPVHTFTCAYTDMLEPGDAIFVDDDGLLKSCERFFKFAGYAQPLAGKGLILGSDDQGETASARTSLALVKSATMFAELRPGTRRLSQVNEPWAKKESAK